MLMHNNLYDENVNVHYYQEPSKNKVKQNHYSTIKRTFFLENNDFLSIFTYIELNSKKLFYLNNV